jgi:hypothetical protein
MVVVLIPDAKLELLVFEVLPVEVLLGALAALGVLEDDELPHAASPTTAAAASTEAANHRLRIVFAPFAPVTRSVFTQEHVPVDGVVQESFDESQAAMRWQSHASESGYR